MTIFGDFQVKTQAEITMKMLLEHRLQCQMIVMLIRITVPVMKAILLQQKVGLSFAVAKSLTLPYYAVN
jgi:hypothetical protein